MSDALKLAAAQVDTAIAALAQATADYIAEAKVCNDAYKADLVACHRRYDPHPTFDQPKHHVQVAVASNVLLVEVLDLPIGTTPTTVAGRYQQP